jgi:site-specific DNA recombinase
VIFGFYARVSTEEQRERSTIDAQVDYARKRAEAEGWEMRLFLDDGVSGTLPLAKRPAGAALLAAIAAKEIDSVATYRVDRLGRKLRVLLDAIDAIAIPYRSLTEPFDTATSMGRAMLGVLGVFAELERDTFIERSQAGTERVAKQEGRWLGGIVPFGYTKRPDLTLTPDERPLPNVGVSQADVVRDIFRLCGAEGWSTNRIADDLNARHVPTVYVRDGREVVQGEIHGTRSREGKRKRATAGTWSPGAVLRILKNETYAGRHAYGRRSPHRRGLIERAMPAIVSPALFERARQQLRLNYRWGRSHARRFYVLRGLLTCECGHALVGTTYTTKTGDVPLYGCASHPKTERPMSVRGAEVEAALWSEVVSFFEHPDETLRLIVRGRTAAADDEDRAERELVDLARELRELEQAEARALDAYVRGLTPTESVLRAKVDELKEQRRGIERRMAQVRDARALAARSAGEASDLRKILSGLGKRARSADAETRAQILRRLVKRARVYRDGEQKRLQVTYAFAEPSNAATPSTDKGSSRQRARTAPGTSRHRRHGRS